MKCYLFFFVAFLINSIIVSGQQTPERVIEELANKLALQMKNRNVKLAAVADFSYQGQIDTRIGKNLADELSAALTMQGANMVNREKVRQELAGAQQPDMQTQSSSTSSSETDTSIVGTVVALVNLFAKPGKALKGTDVIIYGAIEDKGDNLRLVIEMTRNNAKGENVGAAIGNFIKTPEMRELLEGQVASVPVNQSPRQTSTPTTIPTKVVTGTPSISVKHENLTFEVVGCRQIGRDVECKLNIITESTDDELCLYLHGSRIIDASNSHEFGMTETRLADASGTGGNVCKSLVADIPIEAVVKFTNINQRVSSIARLEIKCWNGSSFDVKMYNIPVR